MRYTIRATVLLAWLAAPILAMADDEPSSAQPEMLATEARGIVQEYASALQKTLKASIMTSGPASAIKTCHVHAPGISQQTAALTGWEIARTSSKVRNPNHQPTPWESRILQQFATQAANGTAISRLEHYEITTDNGARVFRYMKAIEVKGLCLNCHGPHVAGPVQSAIDDLYPTDKATGYREGDLRGAFTLSKKLGPVN